jgi:hypothetical protein
VDANLGGAQAQEGKVPTLTRTGWESWRVPLVPRAQAAEAPVSGRAVWQESVRAEGLWETWDLPRDRNEALESEAQERGELKQSPEGRRADAAKRVAKP